MNEPVGYVVRYDFVNGLDEVAPVFDEEHRGYLTKYGFIIYPTEAAAQAEARRRNTRFVKKVGGL